MQIDERQVITHNCASNNPDNNGVLTDFPEGQALRAIVIPDPEILTL